jgi:hypothetical protein
MTGRSACGETGDRLALAAEAQYCGLRRWLQMDRRFDNPEAPRWSNSGEGRAASFFDSRTRLSL